MTVLLTGAKGFLGQNILKYFSSLYKVTSLGRSNTDISVNLAREVPYITERYDVVIHAAGKAHVVPKTEVQKQEFFDVNVTGTTNLLKGLEQAPGLPKSFVFISSVSVYGLDKGNLITERAPLLATDAYGLSKIEAEKIVKNWCDLNNVTCTILRLPLLAGPNPPGNLGAMIKGIQKGYYIDIAGGKAKKSMVLAIDVAKAIDVVAQIGGVYNLTDRYHPGFSELSSAIAKQLSKNPPKNLPFFAAKLLALAGDLFGNKAPINSSKLNKITCNLTFDDTKAVNTFGWNPTPVLDGLRVR